jgi:hypothetical protein
MTKYEGLEKNAVSETVEMQLGISSTVVALEKPPLIGRFSACSSMEKLDDPCVWRRERNWDRTFSK